MSFRPCRRRDKFQSTPSQEGEQQAEILKFAYSEISIHSLARGRTSSLPRISKSHSISIHSLARGRTTVRKLRGCTAGYFNPLPRKRENPLTVGKFDIPVIFQSTPSQEGERSYASIAMRCIYTFQSTPSQEGELYPLGVRLFYHQNFNPLPRKRENPSCNPILQ